MYKTRSLSTLFVVLFTALATAPMLAQSIGSQGPAVTPSQHFSGHGNPMGILVLGSLCLAFVLIASAAFTYNATRRTD